MPRKSFRPEDIIAKLREADVLLGRGKKVAEVVKALGVSEVTYYRSQQALPPTTAQPLVRSVSSSSGRYETGGEPQPRPAVLGDTGTNVADGGQSTGLTMAVAAFSHR